ncbi:hypothetical protein QBC37DRAFT_100198 [Rhypophila decipiens]|uniref:Carboxylesterase family protein n=1 Tax=Rhypophila decipiens TaxID=261697 RepID=A0AAN6YCL9_9PEZI|nr:hypothetical protein QBC37DRAFT_100198 [Rhypophila decipiens]
MAAEIGGPRSFDYNLTDTDSEAEIYEDHMRNSGISEPQFDSRSSSALGGLPLGNIENISHQPSFDTITVALSNFHIHTVSKENIKEFDKARAATRRGRPQVGKNTFIPLAMRSDDMGISDNLLERNLAPALTLTPAEMPVHGQEDFEKYNPVAVASRSLSTSQEQLSKHQAGQFEWVLSIPAGHSVEGSRSFSSSHEDPEHPNETRKLFFGCNLVHRRTQFGGAASKHDNPANIYTLIATQLEGDELPSVEKSSVCEKVEAMFTTQTVEPDTTIVGASEPDADEMREPMTADDAPSPKSEDMSEHHMSFHSTDPPTRIEESVEALDKLEEELEAASEVAELGRVLSLGEASENMRPPRETPIKASLLPKSHSTVKRTVTKSVQSQAVERTSSFRKAGSLVFSMEEGKPAKSSLKKSTVSRPTSMLLTKGSVRSTKPPTASNFELPGQAVARRLKEQKAARLSQHLTSQQVAAAAATSSPTKPHVKSTKPPTRPTFELPGDAISRRKREEREVRLRAQEQEERKRREFKARPIRASIVTNAYPRETAASKARREKLSQTEESTQSAAATPIAKKRQSMTLGAITASKPGASKGTHLSATLPTRGRTSVAGTNGAHISRATSTASTASIHGGSSIGKRSTISAEDVQQQKLRGREILNRDNSYVADRERERREREEVAKLARKEAAERSRQAGREWAQKQQRLRRSMIASS